MRRRRMLKTMMWLSAHAINVATGLFGLNTVSERQNGSGRFSERPTGPTGAVKKPGLTFLCGTGFIVVCGDPDETMLFVDLNEAAKHWRRTGGTTIVTTTLGVVRIEAATRLQAAALSDAIKAYTGPKRFRWMPNVAAGNSELSDLHGFWRDAT